MIKRYCICVFWEKDGIVRDYFTYYLKGLQEVAEKILVVVNGKISNESKTMLTNLGIDILIRENKGIDFWAYKAGIEHIGYEKLSKYDELIFTNCTCYGPIRPLSEMFEEMQTRDCDFWGITKHPQGPFIRVNKRKKVKLLEHIQSYFIVLKKRIFMSKAFMYYWRHLKQVKTFDESVFYHEIGFTKYFTSKGYKADSFINIELHKNLIDNPMYATIKLLETAKLPLIKRKALSNEYNSSLIRQITPQSSQILQYLKDNTNYDINMIYQDILATKPMSEIKTNLNLNFVLSSDSTPDSNTQNNKIALILHIFYEDLIDYCFKYAASMPQGTDVYIVSSKKTVLDLCKQKEDILSEYNIFYREKNNRGRDVSAYLVTCADVFENYDYICCIHDKKTSTADFTISGEEFSKHCFECNLKSKNYAKNIINIFNKNPRIGLLCPPVIDFGYMKKINSEIEDNYINLLKLFKNLDLHVPFDLHPVAPFGAMFWVRGKTLAPLFRHEWHYEDFPAEPLPKDGTISHAIERIYPSIVQEAGYLTGWIMPEDYASVFINNLHYSLLEERSKPIKISFWEKIFSITNIYVSGTKFKQLYILGKKKILNNLQPFKLIVSPCYFNFEFMGIKFKKYSSKIARIYNKIVKKYPNYLSVAVILKDEAAYMQEWIELHRLVGVDKFYIYDNGSLDNLKNILAPYINSGIVEYTYWPGRCRTFEAYNDAVKRSCLKTKWLAIIDADEYIMPVEKATLPEVLKDYEEFGGLGVNWVLFDGNDHIQKPEGLVIENYNRIRNVDTVGEHHIKTIFNPRLVRFADTHNCTYKGKYYTVDENKKPIGNPFPAEHWMSAYNHIKHAVTQEPSINKIRINHYWCKSKEEYIARLKKGFSDIANLDRVFEEERYRFKNYKYDNFADKFIQPLKERIAHFTADNKE